MAWITTRLAVLAVAAAVLLASAERANATRAGRKLATYSAGSSQSACTLLQVAYEISQVQSNRHLLPAKSTEIFTTRMQPSATQAVRL